MNRTESLAVLDEPTSNRKALKAALIALDEYVGHSQDKLADLRLHAASVVARTADAIEAVPDFGETVEEEAEREATPAEVIGPCLVPLDGAGPFTTERSPLDLSAAALVAAMKSRSVLDLAAQLAFLSEGFDFAEVAEALLGATGKKRTIRKTSLDFTRADGVVFAFNRRGWAATATISPDGSVTVLAGSTVSREQTSGPKLVSAHRDQMMFVSATISEDGVTSEDATFPTSSSAATFVCGVEINGPSSWSTPAGFNINEHCDEGKAQAKTEAIAVAAAKVAARAAAKEAKALAKVEARDARAAAKLDAAAEKALAKLAAVEARKAAKAAKVAAKVVKMATS